MYLPCVLCEGVVICLQYASETTRSHTDVARLGWWVYHVCCV